MKIYFAHARNFDYETELYKPLRASLLNEKHELNFPHENGNEKNSRNLIENMDIMCAETSVPSTGVGIELGWADAFGRRIICCYKKGSSPSGSVRNLTEHVIEYTNADDLISKLTHTLTFL